MKVMRLRRTQDTIDQHLQPLVYRDEDGVVKIDLLTDKELVWLTQVQLVKRHDRDRTVIGKHVSRLFEEGELDQNSVSAKFALTAADGKLYQVKHYNLNVVISVDYRVKSKQGNQFRQWATLREARILSKALCLSPLPHQCLSMRFPKSAWTFTNLTLKKAREMGRLIKSAGIAYF